MSAQPQEFTSITPSDMPAHAVPLRAGFTKIATLIALAASGVTQGLANLNEARARAHEMERRYEKDPRFMVDQD